MELKEYEYLIAIDEEGSVSGAARRLYMSQSSLSHFLKEFETNLGTPLFIRTNRGMRPTASGKVYIQHMREILSENRKAKINSLKWKVSLLELYV